MTYDIPLSFAMPSDGIVTAPEGQTRFSLILLHLKIVHLAVLLSGCPNETSTIFVFLSRAAGDWQEAFFEDEAYTLDVG